MSFKVIRITEDKIYLGDEQGSFTIVPKDDLSYDELKIGDMVDYYQSDEGSLIVPVTNSTFRRRNDSVKVKINRVGWIVLSVVLFIVFVVGLFIVFNNSSEGSNSISDMLSRLNVEKDTDKTNYQEVDYDKWNHDQLEEYTKVKISGTVIQESEEDSSYILRVAKDNDHSKIVYVEIDKKDYDNVIAEDDIVTIYGLAMGRTTYETIFHSSVTLPYMQGLIYEVHTEETEENFVTKELYNSDGLKIEQIKNGTLRFYNNSSQKVRVRPESIDVEGQKLNEYSLDLREELQPGQFVDGDINDSEGLLKAGKVINIILKVTNDDYEEITQINISVKLEKDIVN